MEEKNTKLLPMDLSMALFVAYLDLVKTLHKSGAIKIADLANELGNTMDFRRLQGIEPAANHTLLETIYRGVLGLEKDQHQLEAIASSFPKRKPDTP